MGILDSDAFRRVLGHYPTGVCLVTAMRNGAPIGMVVGSFTSVSLEPALVAFLPNRDSTTWPYIRNAGRFCVNVLAHDQQDICAAFTSKEGSRFMSTRHRFSVNHLPIVHGAVAWIDCALEAVHEAGDHYIAIGRVQQLAVERPDPPLIFVKGAYGTVSPCWTDETSLCAAA